MGRLRRLGNRRGAGIDLIIVIIFGAVRTGTVIDFPGGVFGRVRITGISQSGNDSNGEETDYQEKSESEVNPFFQSNLSFRFLFL